MGKGRAYFNVHTSIFASGDICAKLFVQPVFANGFC